MSTSKKRFIFTADDFGMSQSFDRAVFEGFRKGFLTSACICANGESFEYAVNEVLPKCPELDLGVHLNIIEGESLTGCKLLTDHNGNFCHGFFAIMLKSLDRKFLREIETEFRAQIERVKALSSHPLSFLNSHVHTHAIPPIFELVCKLTREYGIPCVRLQAEKLYMTTKAPKFVNLLKVFLLNYFSVPNRFIARKYGVKTSDYILGVGFTGEMNSQTLYFGAKSLKGLKNITTEALIHPSDDENHPRYEEFLSSLDLKLKDDIEKLGFEFAGFKNL